mgnify:CR=1 FL=1
MSRFLAPLWLASCLLPGAQPALAEDFQQALALSSSIEHDSNLRMSAAKQGVTRTILKPTYTLTDMLGVDQFDASLGASVERSSNRRVSGNREDPNLRLGWRRLLETGELGLTARYEEASAQQTQLQETGLVTTDDTRTSWSLGGRWQTALSERATLATNLDYQNVSYDGGTLTNYENSSASLNLGYAWSETIEPFLFAAASHYQPARATVATSDSYSLQGGAKQAIHYTDVSPAVTILAVTTGGNHPFNYLFKERGGQPQFQEEAFAATLEDARDQLLSPVFVGWKPGYLPEEQTKATRVSMDGVQIGFSTPRAAFENLAGWLAQNQEVWDA